VIHSCIVLIMWVNLCDCTILMCAHLPVISYYFVKFISVWNVWCGWHVVMDDMLLHENTSCYFSKVFYIAKRCCCYQLLLNLASLNQYAPVCWDCQGTVWSSWRHVQENDCNISADGQVFLFWSKEVCNGWILCRYQNVHWWLCGILLVLILTCT